MKALSIAFVLVASLAACSGKSKSGSTTGSGDGSSEPTLAKKISLHWGIQQAASSADVFLQTTDETGKQVSHALGAFKGTCSASTPAPEMKALIGVLCKDGATGIELHAVIQGNQVIVMKMRVDDGVIADPMAREELTRIAVPVGAAIEAG